MSTYRTAGHAYLVCSRLLDIDRRHGEHWSKGPPCRAGGPCPAKHEHEEPLQDPEGHTVNDFYWLPGCRPPTPDEHPVCVCGEPLICTDLDDLYDPDHLAVEAVGDGG